MGFRRLFALVNGLPADSALVRDLQPDVNESEPPKPERKFATSQEIGAFFPSGPQ